VIRLSDRYPWCRSAARANRCAAP